jgi:zinc transport system permease protein
MIPDVSIWTLISVVSIAISLSCLGCVVVWQKLAFFSAALAHTTILGVALSLLFSVATQPVIILCTVVMGLILFLLSNFKILSFDVLLGIISYGSLAIGLILLAHSGVSYVFLSSYLFGDISLVASNDAIVLASFALFVLLLFAFIYKSLILGTINAELAKSCGRQTKWPQFIFIISLAIGIALMIDILGLLLITSMLLIPASSAVIVSRSPFVMLVSAILISIISFYAGLFLSYEFDLPSSATVVAICFFVFLFLHLKYLFVAK